MSTDTKASAGAMRAAQLIITLDVWTEGAVGHSQAGWKIWEERSCTKIAEIIDREVAELVEALRHAHTHFIQNSKLSADDVDMLDEMWSTLRRFKEGL